MDSNVNLEKLPEQKNKSQRQLSFANCCGLRLPPKPISEVNVYQENNDITTEAIASNSELDNTSEVELAVVPKSIFQIFLQNPLVAIRVIWQKTVALFYKYYIYMILQSLVLLLPMPEVLSGALTAIIVLIVFEPIWSRVLPYMEQLADSNLLQKENGMRPNGTFEKTPVEECTSFKVYEGWMCETMAYDQEIFVINSSKVVHVRLEGTAMTVSNTTANISHKAMWNENLPDVRRVNFTHHRIYDLRNCRIVFLPENLPKKRYFNRKFPIQLLFKRPCSVHQEKEGFIAEQLKPVESEESISPLTTTPDAARKNLDLDSEQSSIASSILSYNDENVAVEKKKHKPLSITSDLSKTIKRATERISRRITLRKEGGEQTDETQDAEQIPVQNLADKTTNADTNTTTIVNADNIKNRNVVTFQDRIEYADDSRNNRFIRDVKHLQEINVEADADIEHFMELKKLAKTNKQEDKPSPIGSMLSELGEEEEKIEEEPCVENIQLILFARTDREKEDWYRHFLNASKGNVFERVLSLPNLNMLQHRDIRSGHLREVSPTVHPEHHTGRAEDKPSKVMDDEDDEESSLNENLIEGLLLCKNVARNSTDYLRYMLISQQACSQVSIPVFKQKHLQLKTFHVKSLIKKKRLKYRKQEDLWKGLHQSYFLGSAGSVVWLNVLIGRFLYSFQHNALLHEKMRNFLQKKLHAVKMPTYIENIELARLELGNCPPLIHRISQPMLDERGIWVHADVTYDGFVHMIVAAKLRVRRKKQPEKEATSSNIPQEQQNDAHDDHISNEDSDSIDLDAGDVIDEMNEVAQDAASAIKTKRLRVTVSSLKRRFRSSVTFSQNKRKSMHNALKNMNADARLRIDLKGMVARVGLNIPPPPSDRIWFCFCGPPRMWVQARPTLGDRSIKWNPVTYVIERKLRELIQRIMVYPNMVDITIGLLGHPTEE